MPIPSAPDTRGLPAPSAAEQAISNALTERIRADIGAHGGAIDFSRFMELALYAPGLGYYSAGRRKFGAAGDFVTAPELGPLFARCLARPCAQVLTVLGGADILEAGAGSGALAADLLHELEALGSLPRNYLILELSAELRARQTQTLKLKAPHLFDRVHWLETLPAKGFRGVVFGNELLDAMPVERFRMTAAGLQQLQVGWEENRFVWRERGADAALQRRVGALCLPQHYTSEINLHAEAWVGSVADGLTAGVVLLVDYGFPRAEFYHPQRAGGTLMCHYRHRAHADPLIGVGLQDITAHVDFTAIAEAGCAAGLKLLGYTSQASFLLDCDLEKILSASDPNDVRAHLALTRQIKKLTLPQEMGELVKVMALARGFPATLSGFGLQDRRSRL
ncbi:MAG: SAM-dependent methyltransferase [Gammaproteobacteria bacterium]|nr:SAM-dependent methyltransferase [Gammaproteobacteria bacterium]